MRWTTDIPNAEGWYMWRRSERTNDPFYWEPYYLTPNENGGMDLWQFGTMVTEPPGGLWLGPLQLPAC